jgi:uncharacterized protein (UPF0128 family)
LLVTHQVHLLKEDTKALLLNNGQMTLINTLKDIVDSGISMELFNQNRSQHFESDEEALKEEYKINSMDESVAEMQKLLYKREVSRISTYSAKIRRDETSSVELFEATTKKSFFQVNKSTRFTKTSTYS